MARPAGGNRRRGQNDEGCAHTQYGLAIIACAGDEGKSERLDQSVPALTVARICGSGAEAIAVGAEIILAGMRHDKQRPFMVVGGGESMQYPFCLYNYRGKKVGEAVQKYGPIETRALAAGTHLQDMLLMSLYDPSAQLAMANTAEELARRRRRSHRRLLCPHPHRSRR